MCPSASVPGNPGSFGKNGAPTQAHGLELCAGVAPFPAQHGLWGTNEGVTTLVFRGSWSKRGEND